MVGKKISLGKPNQSRHVLRAAIDALEPRRLMASIAAVTPYNGQQTVAVASNLTVRFNEPMTAASLTADTLQLRDAAGNALATTITYNSTTRTATIDPVANLASTSAYYTLRVVGGASGVKDSLSGTLSADYRASFTTAAPTFTETTLFGGLAEPTAMQFADDGRIFVAEKRGVIKVFDSLTDTTPDVFADLRTQVHNYWDRGLLGMTLDPEFTTGKPYVYVLYTSDSDIGGTAPKWGAPNTTSEPGASNGSSTVSGKLSRLTASGNFMTGGEQVLINDWQNQFPSHSIGDLNFGPDGYLYATAGDGASFNAVDYGQTGNPFSDPANEGGAVRSQDILTPGDSTTLDGSVIRIDPATGAAAPNNPFASQTDANAKRIIAHGLRNPFRFTFRPGTSELWIADTGWNTFEEINRVTSGSDTAAENFGWPAYEGPNRQSGYDAANLPVLENLYNTAGAHTAPYFSYNHNEKVAPGSSEPTGGSSPTGISFYTGGAFPAAYNDALLFADYSRKQIYVMYKGPNGLPDVSTRQVFRATNQGAVDIVVGPDGAIYYADMINGRIQRVAYAGAGAVATNGKLTGTAIGNAGLSASPRANAFDGNLSTFFSGTTANGSWVGMDLGSPRWVRKINFAPRVSQSAKMIGGKFQASNSATFASGVVDLHTITTAPTQGQFTSVSVNPAGVNYRYVRYLGANGTSGDVAEIEFHAGDGLSGVYYDNADLTGTSVTRIDPTINFNWGESAPAAGISADTFSTRWTGKIQAIESGTYTFRTTSDDGIKLWVNDVLLIDKFIDQSATSYINTIALTAGQLYNIRIEYFDNTGGASAQLEWQRPGRSFETVPTGNLFSIAPSTNVAPVATIATPPSSLNWKVGDSISFSGSATDAEDGALPASSLSWSLVLIHGNEIDPSNTHEHVIQNFTGVTGGTFIAPDHEYPSWIELRMTATDSSGVSTTVSRRLNPATSQITVVSSPGGAALTFSDRTSTSAITRNWIVGGEATLIAPAQFVSGGLTYVFSGWSDGGALSHEIFAPATNTTYTAIYTLPAPPAAPTNLTAAAVSSTQINLAWRDSAVDETGYFIERRIGAAAWTEVATVAANVSVYSDAALAAGTTYEYRVRATSGSGNSAYSNTITATTVSAAVVPAAPTALAATNITTSSAQLSWTDNANNETGYRVERRVAGGTFGTVATLGANSVSYADAALSPATAYEYRVRAFNGQGDSVTSNTIGFTTASAATVPLAPSNLSAAVSPAGKVTLSWKDNSANETSFKIQRRYSNWIWGDIGTAAANATSFTDVESYPDVEYEYRVLAQNAAGVSDWSNGLIVLTSTNPVTAPAVPQSLAAAAVSSVRVNVTWNDVANNETGYQIDRRTAGGAWSQLTLTAANVAAYADVTVAPGQTYEYRVRSLGSDINSEYTGSVSVTTPGSSGGTVPIAPGGLTGAIATKPQVRLTWLDRSTDETSFIIQRRYTNWIWGDVGTVAANTTTFLDTTAIGSVTYEYRVVAQNAGGASPFSNSVIVSTA